MWDKESRDAKLLAGGMEIHARGRRAVYLVHPIESPAFIR